jgi:hypothetical protein
VSRYRCELSAGPFRESASKRIAAVAGIAICVGGFAVPALAYRPFDGTDAAVADFGEVEIEFQPVGVLHAGSTKPLSDAIFNYGFAERWELVLQSTAQPLPEGAGPLSVPNAAFLKYVLKPGVLQDKPGTSIATEFGPLLPNVGGSGLGFSWTGILSQRWEWGTVHLNIETNLTPDQHANCSSMPSSRDQTSGRSDLFLRFTPTVSSTNRKHFPPWLGPSGR